ncbi:MAG: hypothetical protein KatS3mg072_2575 [Meiothermus sp.]|nr:MAG: hypothetical protein KatS3mg072_2575 [Meiothermus sp.]
MQRRHSLPGMAAWLPYVPLAMAQPSTLRELPYVSNHYNSSPDGVCLVQLNILHGLVSKNSVCTSVTPKLAKHRNYGQSTCFKTCRKSSCTGFKKIIIQTKDPPEVIFLNPRAHPSRTIGEESVSLPRCGIALRYADNFGPVSSPPSGAELTESGIACALEWFSKRTQQLPGAASCARLIFRWDWQQNQRGSQYRNLHRPCRPQKRECA